MRGSLSRRCVRPSFRAPFLLLAASAQIGSRNYGGSGIACRSNEKRVVEPEADDDRGRACGTPGFYFRFCANGGCCGRGGVPPSGGRSFSVLFAARPRNSWHTTSRGSFGPPWWSRAASFCGRALLPPPRAAFHTHGRTLFRAVKKPPVSFTARPVAGREERRRGTSDNWGEGVANLPGERGAPTVRPLPPSFLPLCPCLLSMPFGNWEW